MRDQPVNQRKRIRILQVACVLMVAPLLMAQPWLAGSSHELIEAVGLTLVLLCIMGRMWSILYIGSKKNVELVSAGPYSITRNPLYFFSMLGAVGVGLYIGSLVMAALLGLVVYLVLRMTAAKEAEHLETLFGARYLAYARRTPLLWPKPWLYRDESEVVFSPLALRRTFFDGLLFLAAFPLIELAEYVKDLSLLPVLFTLL